MEVIYNCLFGAKVNIFVWEYMFLGKKLAMFDNQKGSIGKRSKLFCTILNVPVMLNLIMMVKSST